jgi:hypothetical protein
VKRKIDRFFPTELNELREVRYHFIIIRGQNGMRESSWKLRVGDKFVVAGGGDGHIMLLCSSGVFFATNSAVHHYSRKIA